MGCKFCASSDIPFSRSLTSGEILGQIIAINRHENIRIGHVVIMGIGEPLDNYDNIVKFLKTVISEESLGIGARKISLSTCGLVPGMLKLAEEDLAITLSVSLHNPFDEERSEIMPVNRKYSLDNLFEACKIYIEKTGRRITFEYAMIVGVSDTEKHALELCRRLKGLLCHVNLIPVNAVEGKSYSRSSKKSIENFSAILEKKGISVTVRRELGRDINAACGQLRKQLIEEGNG
jgi:23S rRNA (adenine2503-C2)-methyltransferase